MKQKTKAGKGAAKKKKGAPKNEQSAPANDPAAPEKLNRKLYEAELRKLQVELSRLQEWAKETGFQAIVIFEGRDAAGKGGVIKRITERVSPRVFRTVALPAPTEREKTQMYMQRYIRHFPAAGEIVIFDRSWYNRAGVERVMGFCSRADYERFMMVCPMFEREVVNSGIMLIKYFMDVARPEQERRFRARITDPMRQWKLSPMDVESWKRWRDYTEAYHWMIEATDTEWAPWYAVNSNDKRRARLNCISHLLSQIPYKKVPFKAPNLPKMSKKELETDKVPMFTHRVPELF